jgi:hypothetical protein
MSQAGGRWKVLIGTVGVFAVYLYVLSTWTASAVSYEFVLAPLVAIVLAAWLRDEPVTRTFPAGSVMVVAGVYPGAIPPGARRRHRSQRPTSRSWRATSCRLTRYPSVRRRARIDLRRRSRGVRRAR